MRTQVKTYRRTLTHMAKSALVLAGAAGIASCAEWIPASIGTPGSIVAPAAFAPGLAQRGNPPSALRSKVACSGCETGSSRKVRLSDAASGVRRCAPRAHPAAVTTGASQGAENADLLILLDWHMAASNGYGFALERATCSAKTGPAAPMPLEASEAYEILARYRDESGDAPAGKGATARDLDDSAAALRQVTE